MKFTSIFLLVASLLVGGGSPLFSEETLEPQGFSFSYFANPLPQAAHSITSIAWDGSSFVLEDGSVWLVREDHREEVRLWWEGDIVYIAPNRQWSGCSPWVFLNESRRVFVYARSMAPPDYYNPYTRYIVAIDYDYDQIRLNDGSLWNISWADDQVVNRWEPNDTLLIGLNSGGDNRYPFILINCSSTSFGKEEHAAAQLVY